MRPGPFDNRGGRGGPTGSGAFGRLRGRGGPTRSGPFDRLRGRLPLVLDAVGRPVPGPSTGSGGVLPDPFRALRQAQGTLTGRQPLRGPSTSSGGVLGRPVPGPSTSSGGVVGRPAPGPSTCSGGITRRPLPGPSTRSGGGVRPGPRAGTRAGRMFCREAVFSSSGTPGESIGTISRRSLSDPL